MRNCLRYIDMRPNKIQDDSSIFTRIALYSFVLSICLLLIPSENNLFKELANPSTSAPNSSTINCFSEKNYDKQ